MGNYKFRFSDMLPNVWFYKLKDMTRFRTTHQHKPTKPVALPPPPPTTHHSKLPFQSDQRKSYYFTRQLTDFHPNSPPIFSSNPPLVSPRRSSCHRRRKSAKKSRPNRRLVSSSISASCNCQASILTNSASEESVVFERSPTSDHESPPCLKSTKTISLVSRQNDSPDAHGLKPTEIVSLVSHDALCLKPDKTLSLLSQENDLPVKTIPLMSQHHDSPDTPGLKQTKTPSLVSKHHDLPNSPGSKPARTISLLPHLSDNTMMSDSKKVTENNLELSEISDLPPINTKKQGNIVKNTTVSHDKSPGRRFTKTSTSPGMKLRSKVGNRRIQSGRKSVSSSSLQRESLAVVKASEDPGKDFKESMVEMIVENNIRASKDLEDLLACYLLMNSDEYHGIIINVFKQIWPEFVSSKIK